MATYYKVVRVNRRGEYRSAVVNGKACLRYTLGGRTDGFEGMPVLVFEGERQARRFAGAVPGRVVLAGEAGNPHAQAVLCTPWVGVPGFRCFWQRIQGHWEQVGAPEGTYAADWFEPELVVEA